MPRPRIDTPQTTPPLSLILGFGPTLAILALGVLALTGQEWAETLGRLWAAAILIFLAGVARGLSFFTQGGPQPSQVAVSMSRFVCGLGALVLIGVPALALLAAGYLTALIYDPIAARSGEAPRYFAQLRPPQMAIALFGIAALAWAAMRSI